MYIYIYKNYTNRRWKIFNNQPQCQIDTYKIYSSYYIHVESANVIPFTFANLLHWTLYRTCALYPVVFYYFSYRHSLPFYRKRLDILHFMLVCACHTSNSIIIWSCVTAVIISCTNQRLILNKSTVLQLNPWGRIWYASNGMHSSNPYIVENIFGHMHSKTFVNLIMTRCNNIISESRYITFSCFSHKLSSTTRTFPSWKLIHFGQTTGSNIR